MQNIYVHNINQFPFFLFSSSKGKEKQKSSSTKIRSEVDSQDPIEKQEAMQVIKYN